VREQGARIDPVDQPANRRVPVGHSRAHRGKHLVRRARRPLRRLGHDGSGQHPTREHHVPGRDSGAGLPRHALSQREHHAAIVARYHERGGQHLGQLGQKLVGQRRASEQPERTHRRRDDRDLGQQLAADRRPHAVGTDQHVALDAIAVGKTHRDTLSRHRETCDRSRIPNDLLETGRQDCAEGRPVDRGVRELTFVRRPDVRHVGELPALAVDHDRDVGTLRGAVRRGHVALVEGVRQTGFERVATVGVERKPVTGRGSVKRRALEHLALDPRAPQTVRQRQPRDSATGNQDLHAITRRT